MGHRDEALARATEAERVLVDAGPTSARKLDQLRAWRDALQ
jgi:hypothetical protein